MPSFFKASRSFVSGAALSVYRFSVARRDLGQLRRIDSQLTEAHLKSLVAVPDRAAFLERMPKGGVAVEIGVASGRFSRMICDIAAPEKLYLIDYWKDNRRAHGRAPTVVARNTPEQPSDWDQVHDRLGAEIASGQVEVLRGFSWDMIPTLPDRSLDWAYVDAGHDYESVRKDLAALHPKMKPGGIIAGHDYVKWGRFGFRCGVVEAVNAFCLDHEYELFLLSFDARTTPSFAIRPMA